MAGHVVYPDSAVYCGTKFAVRAIMEGLRQEQRENNIKSTIISPGAVQTELYQTISNRVVAETLHLEQLSWGLKAEDIAQAVVFAIDTPDRMSISEMVVRPTTQTIYLKSIPRKEYFFNRDCSFLQNLEFDIYLFVGLLYD